MTPELMTDVINWVGVGTGVVGALVVAPSGPVELVHLGAAAAKRVLPKTRGESVVALAGLASASASVDPVVVRKGISDDVPIADQVAQLVQAVSQLNDDLYKTRQDFTAEDGRLREAIGRIEQNVRQADEDIRQLIAAAERQQAGFNARGLPLIALSIVMTGPANILAENAVVSWLFIVLAGIFVIFAIWPWATQILRQAQHASGTASG